MSDKKKKVGLDPLTIKAYAGFVLQVELDNDPRKMSRNELERCYKVMREAWIKEYSEAELHRINQRKLAIAKQNPTGFLKDIGLKTLNKKILIRLAMLKYNGVQDYPYVDRSESEMRAPFTRDEIAESSSWTIDPPTGHYAEKLRTHIIEVLEEKLNRRIDSGEFTEEGNAVRTFLEDENIYELIADLN